MLRPAQIEEVRQIRVHLVSIIVLTVQPQTGAAHGDAVHDHAAHLGKVVRVEWRLESEVGHRHGFALFVHADVPDGYRRAGGGEPIHIGVDHAIRAFVVRADGGGVVRADARVVNLGRPVAISDVDGDALAE